MTTKYNAQALMDEVQKEHPSLSGYTLAVFAAQRAIERHEAFRQEVHDAVWAHFRPYEVPKVFWPIIIWEPTPAPKPDPLAQTLGDFDGTLWEPEDVLRFRSALDARGFEIREKNDD